MKTYERDRFKEGEGTLVHYVCKYFEAAIKISNYYYYSLDFSLFAFRHIVISYFISFITVQCLHINISPYHHQ